MLETQLQMLWLVLLPRWLRCLRAPEHLPSSALRSRQQWPPGCLLLKALSEGCSWPKTGIAALMRSKFLFLPLLRSGRGSSMVMSPIADILLSELVRLSDAAGAALQLRRSPPSCDGLAIKMILLPKREPQSASIAPARLLLQWRGA